jgi:hypothetical protein
MKPDEQDQSSHPSCHGLVVFAAAGCRLCFSVRLNELLGRNRNRTRWSDGRRGVVVVRSTVCTLHASCRTAAISIQPDRLEVPLRLRFQFHTYRLQALPSLLFPSFCPPIHPVWESLLSFVSVSSLLLYFSTTLPTALSLFALGHLSNNQFYFPSFPSATVLPVQTVGCSSYPRSPFYLPPLLPPYFLWDAAPADLPLSYKSQLLPILHSTPSNHPNPIYPLPSLAFYNNF